MKCPKCGYDNKKGIQFCIKCDEYIKLELNEFKLNDGIKQEVIQNKINIKNSSEIKEVEPLINKNIQNNYVKQDDNMQKFRYNPISYYKSEEDISNKANQKRIKEIISGFIIGIIIFSFVPFFLADEESQETNNYEGTNTYDYSDIKNSDNIANSLTNGKIIIEFNVPEGLGTTTKNITDNIRYYDDKYKKIINYGLYNGNATQTINILKKSYQSQIHSGEKTNANMKTGKITVNKHDVEYIIFTHDYLNANGISIKYSTIIGCSQIGEYLYKVAYYDYGSENILNLNELFKFEVIKD